MLISKIERNLSKRLFFLIIILLFFGFVVIANMYDQLSVCCAKAQPALEAEDLTGQLETTYFSIVVLGDTQYYSEQYPHIFTNQTQWIVDNDANLNLVFVPHLGDVVQNGGSSSEWEVAAGSISLLDKKGISWAVLPGNHDYRGDDNLTNYNTFFGVGNFSGKGWFGGTYPNGTNNNSFALFSGGGNDYLIFNFQHHPSDSVFAWANETLEQYPDRRVIVAAHQYLDLDGMRTPEGWLIWNRFIAPHADQVFLVLCGHIRGEASRTDLVNGFQVHQLLSNYQTRPNGGNGWLRILEFQPEKAEILVKTFSPYLNLFKNDVDSQFSLHYDQSPSFIPKFVPPLTINPTPTPTPTPSTSPVPSPAYSATPTPPPSPISVPEAGILLSLEILYVMVAVIAVTVIVVVLAVGIKEEDRMISDIRCSLVSL